MTLLLGLSSCAPATDLGSYRFENARLVDWATFAALNTDDAYEPFGQTHLVRIEFSSEVDLEAAGSGGGYFMRSDFCPYSDGHQLDSFGPYDDNPSSDAPLSRRERRLPDGANPGRDELLHPSRDPRTHRYHYTAYLLPWRDAVYARDGAPAFDLRTSPRDLCFRIHHPGNFGSSQSEVFTIPGAAIASALQPQRP